MQQVRAKGVRATGVRTSERKSATYPQVVSVERGAASCGVCASGALGATHVDAGELSHLPYSVTLALPLPKSRHKRGKREGGKDTNG